MSDYIDRQAAIAYAISGIIRTLPTSEDGENWIRTAEVRQSLLNVPSAEVEPVKRGKWMEMGTNADGTHNIKCSECGAGYKTKGHANSILTKAKYKFCPRCGAKMEPISASPENG